MTAPALQDKLVEIITQLQSAVKTGADFAIEQLPDIAQQYVTYGFWSSWAFVAIYGLLVAMGIGAVVWAFTSKGKDRYGEPSLLRMLAGVAGSVVAATLPPFLLMEFNTALLVTLAPKVWLLKQLAALIR